MTRKQALLQAINILYEIYESGSNREIIEKLEEIVDEYPLCTWTEKSVIDAIENYAVEHDGKLPNSKELTTENRLPSNTVITNKFRFASINEFFKQYFPMYKKKDKRISSPYKNKGQEYYLKTFKENYIRLQKQLKNQYVDSKTYNQYKESGTPHSYTIIKNCRCKTWNELLILCDFKESIQPLQSTVHITFNDTEKRNLDLLKILSDIKK